MPQHIWAHISTTTYKLFLKMPCYKLCCYLHLLLNGSILVGIFLVTNLNVHCMESTVADCGYKCLYQYFLLEQSANHSS